MKNSDLKQWNIEAKSKKLSSLKDAINSKNQTKALNYAISLANEDINYIKYIIDLIDQEVDLFIKNNNGQTPLDLANDQVKFHVLYYINYVKNVKKSDQKQQSDSKIVTPSRAPSSWDFYDIVISLALGIIN